MNKVISHFSPFLSKEIVTFCRDWFIFQACCAVARVMHLIGCQTARFKAKSFIRGVLLLQAASKLVTCDIVEY